MNIPLENYTDEDVKIALEILKNHNMANGKIKELEKELRIRERPEPEIIKDKWTNDFRREWNDMRKAAKK